MEYINRVLWNDVVNGKKGESAGGIKWQWKCKNDVYMKRIMHERVWVQEWTHQLSCSFLIE